MSIEINGPSGQNVSTVENPISPISPNNISIALANATVIGDEKGKSRTDLTMFSGIVKVTKKFPLKDVFPTGEIQYDFMRVYTPESVDEQIIFGMNHSPMAVVVELWTREMFTGPKRRMWVGFKADTVDDADKVSVEKLTDDSNTQITSGEFLGIFKALQIVRDKVKKIHPIHYSMSEGTIPRSDQLRS